MCPADLNFILFHGYGTLSENILQDETALDQNHGRNIRIINSMSQNLETVGKALS